MCLSLLGCHTNTMLQPEYTSNCSFPLPRTSKLVQPHSFNGFSISPMACWRSFIFHSCIAGRAVRLLRSSICTLLDPANQYNTCFWPILRDPPLSSNLSILTRRNTNSVDAFFRSPWLRDAEMFIKWTCSGYATKAVLFRVSCGFVREYLNEHYKRSKLFFRALDPKHLYIFIAQDCLLDGIVQTI